MKKNDLYSFNRGLKLSSFEHPRVTYAVNKNKRLVKEVIEDMEKTIKPSDEMEKFIKEREELAKKHSYKDPKGNPKLKKNPGQQPGEGQMVYDIDGQDDEKSEYNKALKKMEARNKAEIDKHEAKMEKYNEEFLDDASDYKVFMLPLTLLEAHEKCPQAVMDLIHWMVDDTK